MFLYKTKRPLLCDGRHILRSLPRRPLCYRRIANAVHSLICEVDAEPLERYRPGGYAPVHLNESLKDGRYRIIHKLGWGGYGTVWLARDAIGRCNVAMKIQVSEHISTREEADVLRHLGTEIPGGSQGQEHILRLLDNFYHQSPNGRHHCLVLELVGSNIQANAEARTDYRLPGHLARAASLQLTKALAFIHGRKYSHGDLHTGNLAFQAPTAARLPTETIMQQLGAPIRGEINALPGTSLTHHIPRYIVEPASLRVQDSNMIKLLDFGQAHRQGQRGPGRCPLVFRAPEMLLANRWDHRADLWALGCSIFELIVGYPPFDNIMPTKEGLVKEWIAALGSPPKEWTTPLARVTLSDDEIEPMSISDWLLECYFDDEKTPSLSEADVRDAGEVIESLLRYDAAERPSAESVLGFRWFNQTPKSI